MASRFDVASADRSVSTPPTHYERLGVGPGADSHTLRQAFRSRSKALHPDTTSLPAAEAARQFRLLREAYDQLQDPTRRAAYDASLQQQCLQQQQAAEKAQATPLAISDGWGRVGERRPLSGGEWWALLLLLLALIFCLLLGIGGAWARGLELQVQPSWLVADQTSAQPLIKVRSDDPTATGPDTTQSPFTPLT